MSKYTIGEAVEWKWGSGIARGTIKEVFSEKVSRTIKGSEITKNGTQENPVYLIEQHDGDKVLKLHSELTT